MNIQVFKMYNNYPSNYNSYEMAQKILEADAIPGLYAGLQAAGWNPILGSLYTLYPDICATSSVVPQELDNRCMCCSLAPNLIIAVGYNLNIAVVSSKVSGATIKYFKVTEKYNSSSTNTGMTALHFYILRINDKTIQKHIYSYETAVIPMVTYPSYIRVINNKYVTILDTMGVFWHTNENYNLVMYLNPEYDGYSFVYVNKTTISASKCNVYHQTSTASLITGDNTIFRYSSGELFTYKLVYLQFYQNNYLSNCFRIAYPITTAVPHYTSGNMPLGEFIVLNGLEFMIFYNLAICISV